MYIAAPARSDKTQEVYRASAASMGFVMNLTRAWAWRPEVFDGFAELRNRLTSQSSLTKRDLAVLVCSTAAELGDAYCALAWGKTLSQEADPEIAAAVISDAMDARLTDRDRALGAWARKIVRDPNSTAESDVAELRAVGLGDREVFEATVFAAFRLAFSTVNDALGVSPDQRLKEQVPAEVVAAITFGRGSAEF